MTYRKNEVTSKGAKLDVNWTALPPIQLRGVGTSNVESLQFYLHRLIWTTGIPFPLLAKEVGQDEVAKRCRASGFYQAHGLNNRAIAITYGVERLTGVHHLRCGTLWALSDILSAVSGLGRRWRRRWCPLCYEGWSEHSYEPLIWEIELLGCCPIHSCRLENRCASCGSHQGRAKQIDRRLFCDKCGDFLGKSATFPMRPRFSWWVDEQIEQLIEFCATPRSDPAPWSMYCSFVSSLRSTAKQAGSLKGAVGVVLRDFDRGVRLRAYKPTVRTLINLCAMQGISMQEFLNAPMEIAGPTLFDQWAGLSYLPLPSASQAQRVYVATRCLDDFINVGNAYFPPINFLLERLQVRSIVVRDAIPEIFDGYQEKQASQFSAASAKKMRRAYLCALREINPINIDSDSVLKSISIKVSKYAEVGRKHALMAVKAAMSVKLTQSDERLQYYRTQLPRDRAVDWLLDKWSRNAYRK